MAGNNKRMNPLNPNPLILGTIRADLRSLDLTVVSVASAWSKKNFVFSLVLKHFLETDCFPGMHIKDNVSAALNTLLLLSFFCVR